MARVYLLFLAALLTVAITAQLATPWVYAAWAVAGVIGWAFGAAVEDLRRR